MSGVDPAPTNASANRSIRWARPVSWLIGVALIALAVWAVARSGTSVSALWDAIRAAPPQSIALLLGLIALTPICSSAMFWVLTRRYARITFGENTALTLASWLLNYLPLAPGLLGRLAYLKAARGMPIAHGARVIIWANVLSVIAAVGLLLTLGVGAMAVGPGWGLGAISLAPAALLGAFAWYARIKKPQPDPEVWRLIAALAVRWLELHVWAARY